MPQASRASPPSPRAVTADCGFFFNLQHEARKHTKKPVFLSSLCMAPTVASAYAKDELIALFTADSRSLEPMRELIKEQCGIDPEDKRFVIVGCQDVPIFGKAVADGLKVDWEAVTPHMVKLAQDTVKANPDLRAIIFECTELPPYSDAAVRSPPRGCQAAGRPRRIGQRIGAMPGAAVLFAGTVSQSRPVGCVRVGPKVCMPLRPGRRCWARARRCQ